MNLDDPKLTAFALDELDEPERATIARAAAESVEAQRYIEETRQLAVALKKELEAHLAKEVVTSRSGGFQAADPRKRRTGDRRSLIDLRDEPLFWVRARPLAMAAAVAIVAIVGAIVFGNFKSRRDFSATSPEPTTEIQAEETPQSEVLSEAIGPNKVPNPLRRDIVQRIERVVIGEFDVDPRLQNREMRVIETIEDAYRIKRLKERLATPMLSKKSRPGIPRRGYELMFLDRNGQIVATAAFYRSGGSEFVLQPTKYGSAIGGHYFPDRSDTVLPGNWESGVDYLGYAIPFPDWGECIGYAPGV